MTEIREDEKSPQRVVETPRLPSSLAILAWVELSTVLLIALAILWSSAYFAACFVLGITQDARLSLLRRALATLDLHWKAALLLLIPLFYQTTTTFLGRLKKGPFGIETHRDPEEEGEGERKPKRGRNRHPQQQD